MSIDFIDLMLYSIIKGKTTINPIVSFISFENQSYGVMREEMYVLEISKNAPIFVHFLDYILNIVQTNRTGYLVILVEQRSANIRQQMSSTSQKHQSQ